MTTFESFCGMLAFVLAGGLIAMLASNYSWFRERRRRAACGPAPWEMASAMGGVPVHPAKDRHQQRGFHLDPQSETSPAPPSGNTTSSSPMVGSKNSSGESGGQTSEISSPPRSLFVAGPPASSPSGTLGPVSPVLSPKELLNRMDAAQAWAKQQQGLKNDARAAALRRDLLEHEQGLGLASSRKPPVVARSLLEYYSKMREARGEKP